jgi:hypothetical protein
MCEHAGHKMEIVWISGGAHHQIPGIQSDLISGKMYKWEKVISHHQKPMSLTAEFAFDGGATW